MPTTLDGRVILVTGGSRGIGAAVARLAAQAGADVAIGYKEDAVGAEVTASAVRNLGKRCLAIAGDVSRRSDVIRLVTETEATLGRVDGLVANAGVLRSSPFLESGDDDWDATIRTDLYGAMYCAHAVLPGMIKRGSGSIVMVSSRLGQIGWPGLAAYCSAKAGLIGLTKALAREFAPLGIRVNAVAPAVIVTDMTRDITAGTETSRKPTDFPIGRFGQPDEVAEAVLFLLSDAASLFVGQTLNPNGGGFMP
jgi:3-oxoacyl-[acyl-carrier protein] reductase